MSKGLEALEWLDYYKQIIIESNKTFRPNGFDIIEKELKALEIIKSAGFSLEFDESQNEWFLHISAKGSGIKIYELLKEVLKND